jgi:fermentation-respiration switch protein FrsA (DUF1100 family)
LIATLALSSAAPAATPPDQDPFYAQPTADQLEAFGRLAPGAVLRSRTVAVNGLGIPVPADSWQVAYRSNDTAGRPIAAVATVLVPKTPYPHGPRPLVSYQMAIDSLGDVCQPSYEMQAGNEKETPVLLNLLAAGWAVVVPDFEGPHYAYGAGLIAARTTLDGIRAAERLAPDGLNADTPVGLWGYSGGGQATAWAAEQQATYAPELKVAGIAEGGVPADVEGVLRNLDGGLFFGVLFGASVGTNREFPEMDLDGLLNEQGKALEAEFEHQCAETLITGYPNHHIAEYTNVPDVLAVPRVRAVLAADDLGKTTPAAPVFIFHSVADELIPVAGPDALVKKYCAAGGRIFYQRDARGEHIGYAFTGGVDAFAYLAERFAGGPVPTNCGLLPWT